MVVKGSVAVMVSATQMFAFRSTQPAMEEELWFGQESPVNTEPPWSSLMMQSAGSAKGTRSYGTMWYPFSKTKVLGCSCSRIMPRRTLQSGPGSAKGERDNYITLASPDT